MRQAWVIGILLASAPGCFYATLDTEALENKAAAAVEPADEPGAEVDAGGYTTSLDTPEIELANGDTTRDPCVQTTAQAQAIFTENCSACHAPPASMGSFQSILDFPRLVTLESNTVIDPTTGNPMRLVVPGEPERSRVYLRIVGGEMPPRRDASLPALPRPSLSDTSVLRTWIESCLPADPSAPATPDAGSAAPPAP